MKKSALWTKWAVAGVVLIGVAGCGSSGNDGGAGGEITGSSVSGAVNTATRGKVKADIQGDTVTLTGTVPSQDNVATAAKIAGEVAAGKKVVNNVTVGQ